MKKFFSKDNKLLFAAGINIIILIVCQFVFKLNFEILDEIVYSELIADGEKFTYFSNSFLIVIIGAIQKVIYPINAYAVFALAVSLASMITISYIFFDKFDFYKALILTVLLNGFTATSHYSMISFTRNPALLCTAGLLCILHFIYKQKWLSGVIWGAVLVVVGSFYRFKVFAVVALVFVVYVLSITIVKHLEKDKKDYVKSFFKDLFEPKRLVCGILLVAVCCSCYYIHLSSISNSSELSYYSSYTKARSEIYDFYTPSYEECKEEYDALGVDSEDLFFLDTMRFCDDKAYPLERLQKIGEVKNTVLSNDSIVQVVINAVKNEASDALNKTDKAVLDLAVVIACLMFFILFKKKYWITEISLLLVSAFLYIYLHNLGRVLFRHAYIFWLPVIVFLMYTLDSNAINEKIKLLFKNIVKKVSLKKITALMLTFSIILTAGFSYAFWYKAKCQDNGRFDQLRELRSGISEYVKAHPDDRFELCKEANLFEGNIDNKSIYFINNEGRNGNSHIFQAIYYRLPYFNEFDKQIFGTNDLYGNLFNQNVYYVDYNCWTSDHMKAHLQKYYTDEGENVSYDIVDEVDSYQIVKFSKQ